MSAPWIVGRWLQVITGLPRYRWTWKSAAVTPTRSGWKKIVRPWSSRISGPIRCLTLGGRGEEKMYPGATPVAGLTVSTFGGRRSRREWENVVWAGPAAPAEGAARAPAVSAAAAVATTSERRRAPR